MFVQFHDKSYIYTRGKVELLENVCSVAMEFLPLCCVVPFSLSPRSPSTAIKTKWQVIEVFKGFQNLRGNSVFFFFLAEVDIAIPVLIMRRDQILEKCF